MSQPCFLCEEGKYYLRKFDGFKIYTSFRPDLDPECDRPAHILISPDSHSEFLEMSEAKYLRIQKAARRIIHLMLERGYGPKVTKMELIPGPHSDHLHIHLIFSSDPLRPLKKEQRPIMTDESLENLKRDIGDFLG